MKINLDVREKFALGLGLLALLLVIALAVYVPLGPRKGYLASEKELASLRSELELQILFKMEEAARLEKQKALMEKLEVRPAGFSLFTHVDNLLTGTGLRGRAQLEQFRPRDASPRQPMVQLRLQGVSLEELVDFLHRIYEGNNLIAAYKMDYLRPSPTEKGLDCDITFVTLVQ